jgi:hypothetical protein
VNVAIGQPGTRPYAHTLAEQLDDLNCLVVFDSQAVQRLRFAESFSAFYAAIPLHDAI